MPFPRERARLLVLDATIARLKRPRILERSGAEAPDKNWPASVEALIQARQNLAAAEAIMIGLSGDLRLRRQAMIEAVKVNSELAKLLQQSKPSLHRKFLAMARHDVDQLSAMAKDMVEPFWTAQVEILAKRVEQIGPRPSPERPSQRRGPGRPPKSASGSSTAKLPI